MSSAVTDLGVEFDNDLLTRLFIGGRWVEPSFEQRMQVVSPSTEQVIATIPEAQPADLDRAVAAARAAFDDGPWPRISPEERGACLARVAAEVEVRHEQMSRALSAELGAPLRFSRIISTKALNRWQEFSVIHRTFAFEEEREWPGARGRLIREPVGVVGCVIPWNGPAGTASLKVAPALAAGCTVVIKPAPEAPMSMLILAQAFEAAGLPDGVISVLPAGREAGEHLVRNPDVDKITFTGSTAAGRKIMAICAERIARVTLELGGKSAGIIADDIDLDSVADSLVASGTGNSGQVCAALTRVLVPRRRQQELLDALVPRLEALVVDGPDNPDAQMGPLAAERQRDQVEKYIRLGKEEGARLVTGGGRPADRPVGWFLEPTLFADVTNDMTIAREEIFGPVISVIPYDSLEEAIAIANDSEYGLSGAVFADDHDLAVSVARRIRTGQISINTWSTILWQPFGGYKQSGLGREGGAVGLEAFLETKVIQE